MNFVAGVRHRRWSWPYSDPGGVSTVPRLIATARGHDPTIALCRMWCATVGVYGNRRLWSLAVPSSIRPYRFVSTYRANHSSILARSSSMRPSSSGILRV